MLKGLKVLGVAVLLMFTHQSIAQQYLIDNTKQLYGYLNAGDSAKVSSFFHDDAYVMHVGKDTTFGFELGDFLGVCLLCTNFLKKSGALVIQKCSGNIVFL